MTNLLKDIYSASFYDKFSESLVQSVPSFNRLQFMERIFTTDFESKELKARMRHTSQVLHSFFQTDYAGSVDLIRDLITGLRQDKRMEDRLEFMFFPDYIEVYGLNHYEISIKAIEFITQFVSCEYAVRPFLLKYGERMVGQMICWSSHENHKVRRLASEGSRPRLPWAMAIPELKRTHYQFCLFWKICEMTHLNMSGEVFLTT